MTKGGNSESGGKLTPERLLGGVPHKNSEVELKEDEDGPVLWAEVRRRWWMRPPFSWILPYRDRKGFRMDQLGFEVWQACDGSRTVEQIVEEFAERHRVDFHEARIAVMQFLKDLAGRELIALVFERPRDH